MTNTREEMAVAEAIHQCHYHPVDHGSAEWRNMFEHEKPLAIAMAKAAIAASNSKYIPQLVAALKEIEAIGSPTSLIASIALGELPEVKQ